MFLGSAPTGQAVTVDAASLEIAGDARTAWFRLFAPLEVGREVPAYRLRVDCSDRTVNAMAVRHYGANGEVARQEEHGPSGEGPAPVEAETATDVVFEAVCTQELERLIQFGRSARLE